MPYLSRGEAIYDGEQPVAIANRSFDGLTIYWDKSDFRFVNGYSFNNPDHREMISTELRMRRDETAKADRDVDWRWVV